MEIIFLNEKQVEAIIPAEKMPELIEVVEKGFFDFARDEVQMPAKLYLYSKEGDQRVMPAYSSTLGIFGTKIVTVHPKNSGIGLPTVMAAVELRDAKNGLPLVRMDAAWLTGMRTGAGGAIAVKYLARKDAATLGVIGAGKQAFFQIVGITKVREIKEIFVYDLVEEKIEELAKDLTKMNIKIKKATLEEAVKNDILVTTTPVRTPIVKDEWVLPGTHINAIGADAEGKEEIDPRVLERAKIVVDDWGQASHSGEINVPLKMGVIGKEDIWAELGEIIIGKKPGRESEKEITVFDSTGLAVQDLYPAHFVYEIIRGLS